MNNQDIEQLKSALVAQTAKSDAIRLARIERYISFLRIDAQCDAEIKRDGTSVKIENGSQTFTKQHPAIETKLRIQKELEKLEDALGITSSSSVEDQGSSLI